MSILVRKFIVIGLLCVGSFLASAADSKGIKSANLKGADLDLMNDHDPASELANFEFLPGYQANLFAADPMLANPIHMHWDSRGRLWVACSWTYPQIKPGAVADDKIIILEDTDNDGKADKSTVFADGLYLPTGIELANGGCYVGQSPDVFFLKDTDGDDVADVKELALTGFGIEDSHHSISAWRRGPGGWIYFQEGIFLHSQIETQYGVIKNFNGGVYQFNPRTQELRVFCTGTGGNPWGHVFDKWGQSFMVNNPRIMYLSPSTGNSGENVQVKPLISTEKQCGGELASGTHVCDDVRGNLLSGRFKSRAVIRYEFIEDGAGFSARVREPLMTSKHPNFRPVDVKMGPDGAVYVADWYNSIINHAQHDFRDPRRDHDHGRIWRVTHKERPLVKKPTLKGISISELVNHLGSPEDWVRHQVRNELTEYDSEAVLVALESWVEKLDDADTNYDLHLVEAMWACQNVEQVSEAILSKVLNAKSGHARSAGARVLRYWYEELSDPIAMLAKAAADPFPRTRMEAVLSAGFIPQPEAFTAALHVTDYPGDQFLDQALPQTLKALEPYWRPALEAGTLSYAKDSHKAYVDQKAGIGFDKRFATFLEKGAADTKDIQEMMKQFVAVATERDMRRAVDTLIGKNGTPDDELSVALLETLKSIPAGDSSPPKRMNRVISNFRRILDHENDTIVRLAIDNLGEWQAIKVDAPLLAILKSETRSMEVRQAAALALAKLGGNLESLSALATSRELGNRYAAMPGLVHSDLEGGVAAAVTLLVEEPGDFDPVSVLQQILKNRKGSKVLTAALKGQTLHPEVVKRVAAFHRTTGQLPKSLSKLFQSSKDSLSALLLAEDQSVLAADVIEQGDPHRGETIYRRKAIACTNCHAIGSAGPAIGPNLVAVGAAATAEYMIESILEPNAAIAEHYENRLFTLKDGTVRMGVITFKSDKEVVIRDSAQAGKEIILQAVNVLKEQAVPSLMPAGLADQLNDRQEFLDLAKFLSELGRPGDFANDETPVLRKWRIAPASAEPNPNSVSGWLPAYSLVNGELPDQDLAPFGNQVFVRSFVDVLSAGDLAVEVNDISGLRMWIDEKEVEELTTPISLSKGKVTITFAVDRSKRVGRGIRVELKAPAGSEIKFQPEGGM